MGVLRVCVPGRLAPAYAASSFSALPRGTQRLPLKKTRMGTARLRHVCRVLKSRGPADQPWEPDPEDEDDPLTLEDVRRMINKDMSIVDIYLVVAGHDRTQDNLEKILDNKYFSEERDKIEHYQREIASNTCFLYSEGRRLALVLCSRAREGVNVASKVMAYARLRANKPSAISLPTVKQTIGMYVSTFLKIADDTFHRKVDQTIIILFLGALGGLAGVSHILFEDALDAVNNMEGSSPNYNPDHDVEAINCKFQQKMKDLEDNFVKASRIEACKLLPSTIRDAIYTTRDFIITMTNLHEEALVHLSKCCGPSNDWEPGASAEMGPDSK